MARPRISVVVPGRDVAEYVADALTSLTRQVEDPDDLEVVMVDDGSRDATPEIVARFTGRIPRLTVLTNETPVGLASARNQGIAATTGRYLAFLDADDWLAPGHLTYAAEAMEELAVDILRVDHTTVDGRRRSLRRAPQARRSVALDPRTGILPTAERTMVDYPYAWAGMFHRSLAEDGLLRFPDGLRTAEDRPWIWRLFLRAGSYAVVDAPGICYRRGLPGSLSRTTDLRQLDVIPALRQTIDLVEDDPDSDRFLPKLVRTVVDLLSHHLRRSARMPAGARESLRAGAGTLLGRLPRDLLAHEAARTHPGRAWVLHGLLPAPERGRRHGLPERYVRTPVPPPPPPAPTDHVVVLGDRRDTTVLTAAAEAGLLDGAPVHVLASGEVPGFAWDPRSHSGPGRETETAGGDDLAALLDPVEPAAWRAGTAGTAAMLARLFHVRWGLGPRPHLVVPSLQHPPARTLAELLPGASLTLCSARAEVYRPASERLPPALAQRLADVWHSPDHAEQIPWLSIEYAVPARAFPDIERTAASLPAPEAPMAQLAAALGYVARPDDLPWLRGDAARFLTACPDQQRERWFDPARLAALDLPGGGRRTVADRGRRAAGRAVRHPATGYLLERSRLLRALDAVRSRQP
ncbi:glycosyltransferase [Georgenia deserti]|uniref:Glycosyltransferase n=1 Tax=Georgenia deserti TaxID=2093781 RepID=A0ABW4L080_9MICO